MRPSRSASGSPGLTVSEMRPPWTLTASGTSSPASARRTERATEMPAFSWASSVDAPRCGVATTCSKAKRGLSVQGSLAYTSRPAPATRPSASADARAASSTIPPRAALTMCTVGLTLRSASSPISPRVSGVLGRCTVMKSDSASSSSSETIRTPICAARAGWTYGSYAISETPNADSRCATRTPIRPRPTTPTVLSCSSTPEYFERFQAPPLSAALAGAMLRALASSSATASSAAETMFDCGALTTITPACVAAGTSTLSRPTPARATTLSRLAAASASASTWVALRIRIASTSAIAGSSAARSAPSQCRISKSGPRASTVAGESSSAIRTTGLVTAFLAARSISGSRFAVRRSGIVAAPATANRGGGWGSAGGGALDVVVVAGLDPGHQLAQLAAGLLDRVLLALGPQRLELRCAGVLVGDEAARRTRRSGCRRARPACSPSRDGR